MSVNMTPPDAPSPARGAASLPLRVRAGVLFVAATLFLVGSLFLPGAARAAHLSPPAAPGPAASTDDGLTGGGFYLEADTLISDEANHLVKARGAVEARYKGRVLRAEEVDYDSQTGVVTARGAVKIINADGTAQFADALTLDKDMSEGVAVGFSTRLRGDIKIAAASARRRSEQVTALDHVVYTPCEVCAENGQTHPTWSIRARTVVQDKRRQTLTFKGAVIQVKGVGVIYLPFLRTADPSADRKSGLLLPVITYTGKRGISYEQPYYQVITKSQDITFTPQINSKVNPFLNLEYRKRFYSGVADVRAGYTYERDFTSGGAKFGALTSRSYILGSGVFDLTPHWRWGFTAERTSDKLIFDKYAIGDVFRDRGLYAADDRRLISQIYAVRQDELSYLSIAAIAVQGLRTGDQQNTFPVVAPLIEGRYEPARAILGGRLRIDASAVVLTRDQSSSFIGVPGTDSRRATVQSDWRRTFTFGNGLRVAPFLSGRADVYGVDQLPPPHQTSATLARAFGTAGIDLSYPLFKQSGAVSYILEPLVQVAVSKNSNLDPRIPNEDSTVFEFDETNLFSTNRSPGFDLYEGGRSVTVGGRATAILADGRSGSLLFGRRLASADDPVTPQRTGLRKSLSDYILAADLTPIRGVRLFSRLRLDADGFAVNRLEAGAEFSTSRALGSLSYLQEAQSPAGARVKSLDIHLEAYPLKHWGVTAYVIVDGDAFRRRDFGLVYRDSCARVEVLYRHDETFNGTLGPSSAVVVRLTLATLGNSGYSR